MTKLPALSMLLCALLSSQSGCVADTATTASEEIEHTAVNPRLNHEARSPYEVGSVVAHERIREASYWTQFVCQLTAGLDQICPSTVAPVSIGGSALYATMNLDLRADGTFTVDYREWRVSNDGEYVLMNGALPTGKWRVDGDKLVLKGVGTAEAFDNDGVPAMKLTFDRDLVTAGLAGSRAALVMTRTPARQDRL